MNLYSLGLPPKRLNPIKKFSGKIYTSLIFKPSVGWYKFLTNQSTQNKYCVVLRWKISLFRRAQVEANITSSETISGVVMYNCNLTQ